MSSILPYIGGKNRLAKHILPHLVRPGVDCLVDVFGGSGAVTMACGTQFAKRIYNEINGDFVNFFQVLSTDALRVFLFRRLRNVPPSRQVFRHYHRLWLQGDRSFAVITDPVERAAATFYRHHFCFGGKVINGGCSVSTGDRTGIKEVVRYRNTLRQFSSFGAFWKQTFIESMDCLDAISAYGGRANVVLFCDPPYDGFEHYYSSEFTPFHKFTLPSVLTHCQAHVVLTFYDTPCIRDLYPETRWHWHFVQATKNASFRGGQRHITEVILVKKENK